MEYREACRTNEVPRRNTMDLLDFRLAVAEALCSTPTRKRSVPGEEVDLASDHTEQLYKVAKLPGKDKRLDMFDHWPTVDNLKTARACRLSGCDSRSRTRCEKCNIYLCLQPKKSSQARGTASRHFTRSCEARGVCMNGVIH